MNTRELGFSELRNLAASLRIPNWSKLRKKELTEKVSNALQSMEISLELVSQNL